MVRRGARIVLPIDWAFKCEACRCASAYVYRWYTDAQRSAVTAILIISRGACYGVPTVDGAIVVWRAGID